MIGEKIQHILVGKSIPRTCLTTASLNASRSSVSLRTLLRADSSERSNCGSQQVRDWMSGIEEDSESIPGEEIFLVWIELRPKVTLELWEEEEEEEDSPAPAPLPPWLEFSAAAAIPALETPVAMPPPPCCSQTWAETVAA